MRDLIQYIEGNFRQYFEILNKIGETGENDHISGEPYEVRELLYTLAGIQDEVVDYRLKKILKEEHPYIPHIEVEKIKRKGQLQTCSLDQIVQNFLSQRRELLKLLYSLPMESWNRTGVLEKEGHVSFRELIRRLGEKDQQILAQLSQALVEH